MTNWPLAQNLAINKLTDLTMVWQWSDNGPRGVNHWPLAITPRQHGWAPDARPIDPKSQNRPYKKINHNYLWLNLPIKIAIMDETPTRLLMERISRGVSIFMDDRGSAGVAGGPVSLRRLRDRHSSSKNDCRYHDGNSKWPEPTPGRRWPLETLIYATS
jgi:hypothetical protein